MDHSYLTKGYSREYAGVIKERFSDYEIKPLNPAVLYQQTGPEWPKYDQDANQHGAGDKWARRQFSSLWAPMPVQYNLSSSTAHLSPVISIIPISSTLFIF